MNTKPIRGRRSIAPATGRGSTGSDLLADFGREQLAVAMEASCAMFRGVEAMRTIQQQASQQTAARHETAARRLREARDPAELITIPAALLQQDLQGATRYWQELAAAAFETQTEMMGSAWQLFDADTALRTVSAVEALEAIPGVTSLFPSGAPFTRSAAARD